MTSTLPLRLAALLVAAHLFAAGALAECDDLTASPSSAQEAAAFLADLVVDKCLGGAPEKPCLEPLEDLCRRVDVLVALPPDEDDPSAQDAIVDAFLELAPDLVAPLEGGGDVETHLATEMRRQFMAISQHGKVAAARSRFTPVGHTYFAGGETEIDLEDFLRDECPGSCAAAFHRAVRISTLASLYRRSLTKLTDDWRRHALEHLDALDARWQAYFESARSQFPWELAVNSWRYDRSPHLVEPPTSQIIVLHPEPVFEVTTEGDSELEEALALELIGFHRWTYEGTQVARPLGVSLLATWRGSAAEEVGYGLIVHLPRFWSLGATYREDQTSIVVSTDLAKLVTNKRGLFERIFP